jgi:hypothetical protein
LWKKSVGYGSEQFQCSDGDGALCRPLGRPQDRKTTGITKPLRPEFNFGKEKVKFGKEFGWSAG